MIPFLESCAPREEVSALPTGIVQFLSGSVLVSGGARDDATLASIPERLDPLPVGDLDGDGLVDLVFRGDRGLVAFSTSRVAVGAEGTTGDLAVFAFATAFPGAVGDLTGDGGPDLALWAYDTVDIYSGAGLFADEHPAARIVTGSARTAGAIASPGDLDGDGSDELVIAEERRPDAQQLLLGPFAGDRDLSTADLVVTAARIVPVGDLDGDGGPELAVEDLETSVFRASDLLAGGPALWTHALAPVVPLGDFDGDGIPDVGLSTPSGLEVFTGPSVAAGAAAPDLVLGRWDTVEAASVDLDGDGVAELLVRSDAELAIYRADGLATDAPAAVLTDLTAHWYGPFAVGDLDGDGGTDLVYSDPWAP